MKKILLSFLMLCTAMSAWSYETKSVTLLPTSAKVTDSETGIYVQGTFDSQKKWWKVGGNFSFGLFVPEGYVVTGVLFAFIPNELASNSESIENCDKLVWNAESNEWVQTNGAFAYYSTIRFTSSSLAFVRSVRVTYHKHTLTEVAEKSATCIATGTVHHWHCTDCGRDFSNEGATSEITNTVVPIDPTNHDGNLQEVAFKNASVVEEGVYHHWHCLACDNDYADADATEDMNGQTVKARYKADALLVGNTTVDESHLLGSEATVTFDGNNIVLDIDGDDHAYTLSKSEYLTIDFAHTFRLTANEDPDNLGNFYSTFYTSEGAYKVPETAKAYAGEVKSGEETDVLNLTNVGGIIHASEAVILKATGSDITLMPSYNKAEASTENVLEGTDVAKTLGADQYALSLGQKGVGFYLWNGKEIGANKAYLTLNASFGAKAFTFQFDNGETTAIEQPAINGKQSGDTYNLNGVRVNDNYKGIVIKNGKKIYQK